MLVLSQKDQRGKRERGLFFPFHSLAGMLSWYCPTRKCVLPIQAVCEETMAHLYFLSPLCCCFSIRWRDRVDALCHCGFGWRVWSLTPCAQQWPVQRLGRKCNLWGRWPCGAETKVRFLRAIKAPPTPVTETESPWGGAEEPSCSPGYDDTLILVLTLGSCYLRSRGPEGKSESWAFAELRDKTAEQKLNPTHQASWCSYQSKKRFPALTAFLLSLCHTLPPHS